MGGLPGRRMGVRSAQGLSGERLERWMISRTVFVGNWENGLFWFHSGQGGEEGVGCGAALLLGMRIMRCGVKLGER